HHGLIIVFTAAALMSAVGALVSLLRGGQFYYEDEPGPPARPRLPAVPRPRRAPRPPRPPAPGGPRLPAGPRMSTAAALAARPSSAAGPWPRPPTRPGARRDTTTR